MTLLGKYSPARGGHAPGHLRDVFIEALDAFDDWKRGEPEPQVAVGDDEVEVPISKVFGWLHNCSDIIPGHLFDHYFGKREDLEATVRSRTYGALGRGVLRLIRST